MPLLRRLVEPSALRQIWNRTFDAEVPSRRHCPACHRPMLQVAAERAAERIPLDVCRGCQLLWFDADEFEAMPPPPPPPPRTAPTEIDERLAAARATAVVRKMQREAAERAPDLTDLRLLPALLGMPVELHGTRRCGPSWATWLTAAAITAISIVAFLDVELRLQLAFVPEQTWRFGGATMITAFFVHGGWWHLLGNLYFFLVFGDDVEDFLGRPRWLLLVVGATVAGALLHALGTPDRSVPCVGASGGISGLLTFYALRFPRARLGTYLWMLRIPQWVTFPAWGGFAVWVLMQLLVLTEQLTGFGRVSALAHLGGAMAGVGAWLLTRDEPLGARRA